MAWRSTLPSSSSQGVVTMTAVGLWERSISTTAASLLSPMPFVRLRTMVPAFSTWLHQNSPKFFMYILARVASTTVVKLPGTSSASPRSCTARMTSLSLPTPLGSMSTRSGLYSALTFSRASAKSPTRLQQMQPELISRISMPASFKKPPSTAISPNSFSMSTSFSP